MKQLLLRVSDELHGTLREKAHKANRSINEMCVEILEAGLEEDERPANFTRKWEWSGYTVRPGKAGWIVENWSGIQGQTSGRKILVPYGPEWSEGADLHSNINECTQLGEYIYEFGPASGGARVLRTGSVVR